MGAASKTGSCICASLSLPWPVRRPAVSLGRFLTLDLVVRCLSTSGAVIEFWCPGTRCWSPVPYTLRRLGTLSVFLGFEVLDPGFLPPTSGRSFIGGTSARSGLILRVTAVSLAFGLATAVFRGGFRFTHGYSCRLSSSPLGVAVGDVSVPLMPWSSSGIFSGQFWPFLDFPCCGFSAGVCRYCLASPSRCLSEYALSCHRLVSPRCGCV